MKRSRIDKILWWIIAALAAVDVAIIVAGFLVHVEGHSDEVCYSAWVSWDYASEIRDGVFYIPLAWKGDTVFPLRTQNSGNWKVSVADTEYGKMLKLEVNRTDNENVSFHIFLCIKTSEPIDTLNPFDEWILKPKYNVTVDPDCPLEIRCYRYYSLIYAKYNATGNISVGVSIDAYNRSWENVWWYKRWCTKTYDDDIRVYLPKNWSGWLKAEGSLRAGRWLSGIAMGVVAGGER